MGIGHMALLALKNQLAVEGAPPAVFKGIPQGSHTGGLPHQAPVRGLALAFKPFHHPAGAVQGRALLVAGDQKGDGPLVVRMIGHEPLAGGDHGR